MTTNTLAKLAACPFCGTGNDEIMLFIEEDGCRLQCAGCNIEAPYFETYDEAASAWSRRALTEPFGYFKAEPFGWTDCAETDDGAVALYERPQQAAQAPAGWREQHDRDSAELRNLCQARDVARQQRDHARACYDSAVKLLTGIHALLYPAPITVPDGRTMVFRPNDLDPHAVLQELSDRIRALPDALAALSQPPQPQSAQEDAA